MSIFPQHAKCYRAPHKQGAGADAPSQAKLGEDMASSKTEHRFDKFARRIAANMLTAIRTSLSVFSSPDRERWPAERLLEYLKGAEDLARDMLREIAAKLTLTPQPLRERRNVSVAVPREKSAERAPCFRLGVNALKPNLPERAEENTSPRHPPIYSADLPPVAAQQVDGGPGLALRANRDDDAQSERPLQSRLAALEDVLQHPGKHAARMARALYRAENGSGQRLIVQSEDDLLITSANRLCNAPANALPPGWERDFSKIAHLFDDSS